jgi:uncharacterized protein (TIGR02996 family)
MSRILGSLGRLWHGDNSPPPTVEPLPTEEDGFLQAIRAAPDDDTPRLIYADWLEERGDPRAEFIRIQCERARLRDDDARQGTLRAQERRMLAAHHGQWVAPLRPFLGRRHRNLLKFSRGFVEGLLLRTETFIAHAAELCRRTPLRYLHLTRARGRIAALAACPQLAELALLEFCDTLRREDIVALAHCPYLSRLPKLALSCEGTAAIEAEVLVNAPQRARETVVHGTFGERVLIFGAG